MYFFANVFKVDVNDSIFSGNEQQKVYFGSTHLTYFVKLKLIFQLV